MSAAHRFHLRAYYEDTDASGVVYHASYLRWFERARTEWLRGQGGGHEAWMRELGVAFTVSALEVRYLKPVRLDAELEVQTRVVERKRARLVFEQRLLGAQAPQLLHATARVTVACVDLLRFRPCALPERLRADETRSA
jgi:acyl-CoA thioester hydrolase